jgi:hypothetical protein
MTDEEIINQMADEILRKPEPMEIVFEPGSVMQLSGLVQLALRHPDLPRESRAMGEGFLAGVREYFADSPTVLDVIFRGEDPNEDR